MEVIKVKDYNELSEIAANIMIDAVTKKPNITLGLATGGTPVGLYENLVKDYQNNGTSYKEVTTFNLDEYIGLEKTHDQSYSFFMHDNLFDHIDITEENVHVPCGTSADHIQEAKNYEQLIDENPIDFQLIGIGVNGHIGFNEPGTHINSVTSVVQLTDSTIEANARYFEGNEQLVPTKAISMGIGTIRNAKQILLIITGLSKAKIVKQLIEDPASEDVPASLLKDHPNFTIIIDEEAASLLDK